MNFYFEATKVLDQLDTKTGSIKSVLGNLPENSRKRTTALIIETLKYKSVLIDVIHASGLLQQERKKISSQNLALLLAHDLLLSKGIQAGDGPIKQAMLRHKTRLHAELTKVKVKRGVASLAELAQNGDLRSDQIPRYVRVNTLTWSMNEAIKHFTSKGFHTSGDPLQSKLAFTQDAHVPNLLLFHSSTSFHEDSLLDSGKIILQDKASCFPAIVLNPPSEGGSTTIDATAAPGNKTTLLSALMNGHGKIYAFERDKKRYATLRKMLAKAHCNNVEPRNLDFLSVDPNDTEFSDVSHILLDPSCSGSGIVNRLDYLLDAEDEVDENREERLQKLAAFQLMMIKHAMKFPAVQKIVYSTCSVHAIENEEVVSQALASDDAQSRNFRLARREDVLTSWPRRGIAGKLDAEETESLIRCVPGEDHTNGFFVSCFVRSTSRDDRSEGNTSSMSLTGSVSSRQKHRRKRTVDVEDSTGEKIEIKSRGPSKRRKG